MKRLVTAVLFALSLVSPVWAGSESPTWYFSPGGGCTQVIIRELDRGEKSFLVQAYSFTALVTDQKRGVRVEVILDRSQVKANGKYSAAKFFQNMGIPLRIDAAHAIAHNKVMVIDGETVITGSFNFTKAAEEKNLENLR